MKTDTLIDSSFFQNYIIMWNKLAQIKEKIERDGFKNAWYLSSDMPTE